MTSMFGAAWSIGSPVLILCAFTTPSGAFMLAAPTVGAVLTSGQRVEVRVDPGEGTGVGLVRYYWYRQDEEPASAQQAHAALEATATSSPPYGGILTVPLDAIGTMRLLVVGEVTRGRLAGQEEFDEILVTVEPSAELTGIKFETEKPLRLDTLGRLLEVAVVGQFADGVVRRVGGSSAGSTYLSSNKQVVRLYPEGWLRVISDGRALVTVTNRGKIGTLEVIVKSDREPNRVPIARVVQALRVKAGATVVLDGLHSSDPDGDPLKYEWSQVRGNKVSLLDPGTPKATFVAPRVSSTRLLRIRFRVTDMRGPDTVKGADSLPLSVDVWVEP